MAQSNQNILSELGEAAKDVAGKAAHGLAEFGSNVVEKTKGFAANSKLTSEKDEKKKELEENYIKLGKLAYQSGNLTGEMKTISEQIKQIYSQLQELEVKLNAN